MSTTPQAARRIHAGRKLTRIFDDGDADQSWPEVAYESIRGINHLTSGGPIPAPVVYDVLGNLKGIGHMLPQALTQLGDGLLRSLDEFDVYDNKGDARTNATNAVQLLMAAAEHAEALGAALEAAQGAINSQGYRAGDEADDA